VKTKKDKGFTLIELMVVIAVIALLSSIALIALQTARIKSRNAKRLSDMVQMNNALELYFANFKGYPSSATGLPSPGTVVPNYASTLPIAPQPADGGCELISYPLPGNGNGNQYYYTPSGTAFLGSDGTTLVYPDYDYFFCLGSLTGNFSAGVRIVTPHGVQ
jgi:prepilin-type N-terminal cleavage/methylation domain-containing protein